MPETMELSGHVHTTGNKDCAECPSWMGYPHEHQDCGGLIHGDDYDETYNEESGEEFGYVLANKCDRCGQSE